jgi:ring-1,2-phenylacetyl-CoA epoxidase subunit PaaD
MSTALDTLAGAVDAAVRGVDDPEYPGVSIADLGLVEDVRVHADGSAEVDLVPTFVGCPALDLIRIDVQRAVESLHGVRACQVRFVDRPTWSPERISAAGRVALRHDFTVAVPLPGRDSASCPRCGQGTTVEVSAFGPSPCRAIHRCPSCGEPVEVVRR